jgi:hypothetical protein
MERIKVTNLTLEEYARANNVEESRVDYEGIFVEANSYEELDKKIRERAKREGFDEVIKVENVTPFNKYDRSHTNLRISYAARALGVKVNREDKD